MMMNVAYTYYQSLFNEQHCYCETEISSGSVRFGYVGQSAVKSTFLASAIRKCGGNEEKGNLLYTAYGSSGQVHKCYLTFV